MNTATVNPGEKQFKVSCNGEEHVVPASKAMDVAEDLFRRHNAAPSIEALTPEPAPPPPTPIRKAAVVAPVASVSVKAGEVDESAKKRIDEQQKALREAGVKGLGFRGEGGDGDQFFRNGTRMLDSAYGLQDSRKAEHEAKIPIEEAAMGLSAKVRAEGREDYLCTARDVANNIEVHGQVKVFGRKLTEQAIRGLTGRCESPALSYILGLYERVASERAKEDSERNDKAIEEDLAKAADVVRHECLRNGDKTLKLRMRANPNDIFACVSPGFAPADAPEVVTQVLGKLPKGAKGTWTYHPVSTQWELRADVWTPTPTDKQAVGEPFAGYASFRARDNGTSRFNGGGGIEVLRCLNASVYVAEMAGTSRVHRGLIMYDIEKMLAGATAAISVLCKAWGQNREIEIPMPVDAEEKLIPLSEAIPGFWRSMLTDRRSELVGILPGRTENHVKVLSSTFASERRVPDRLVRSDFGQALTRYVQRFPLPIQREAEATVGSWLLNPKPFRCELRDEK
jgi:hypothetical protein